MSTKTKRLTESAMLLAVAVLLELLSKTFIPEMTFGGQLTIVSMLPIVLIAYMYGTKWGLLCSATYAVIQILMAVIFGSTAALRGYFIPNDENFMGFGIAIGIVLLDYVVAYTVLGLGGVFRNKLPKVPARAPIATNTRVKPSTKPKALRSVTFVVRSPPPAK